MGGREDREDDGSFWVFGKAVVGDWLQVDKLVGLQTGIGK
jgi:hypothetical protein